MITLGIANGETSSAVLFNGTQLIAAVSEERFSRKKMDDSFPYASIDYVLKEAGIKKTNIDIISYAWSKGIPEDALSYYLDRVTRLSNEEKKIFFERLSKEQTRDLPRRNEFWEEINKDPELSGATIEDFYHHEAHALSACTLSPFDKCAVLTCDGRGDYESLTFSVFNKVNNSLKKLYSSSSSDSLGFFYGRITGLLGFKPCRHEGKITGLAAYGDPKKAMPLMKKMIEYKEGHIFANLGDYYLPFYTNYSDHLVQQISSYSNEDIAAAAQLHLEEILVDFVSDQYKKHNLSKLPLCLAGGVFNNVKLNAKLRDIGTVSNLFVQPQMGDGGLALGAVCGSLNRRGISPNPVQSMSLGPVGGDIEELISEKKALGYTFKKNSMVEQIDDIVNYLSNNKVIGLVRGRMEFGPRALCNRSILYKTSDVTCNDWLNKRMSRTEFIPFAPVMTAENGKLHLKPFNDSDSSLWFMTTTVEVSENFRKLCPAVTHIDNTARPQIVSKNRDPWLHKLLGSWEELSGELSLINTSFNQHEEPIVCTYNEAFYNLENGVVDVLVLDNWIVTKNI